MQVALYGVRVVLSPTHIWLLDMMLYGNLTPPIRAIWTPHQLSLSLSLRITCPVEQMTNHLTYFFVWRLFLVVNGT